MNTLTTVLTITLAFCGFAAHADVEAEVQSATAKVSVVNNPTTNTQGKVCAMMKAADAGGVDSEHKQIVQGNNKNECNAYISDSGQLGDKGKVLDRVLSGQNKDHAAYKALFLSNDSIFGKEGGDEGHGGVSFCPGMNKDMPQADRIKVYVKLLAELAKNRSGCAQRTPAQEEQANNQGEFNLPRKVAQRKGYGESFNGSMKHCTSNQSVSAAAEGSLCALDMLGDQLRALSAKEKAETNEDKKRKVGIESKQSLFDELNPDKYGKEGSDAAKKHDALIKAFENFAPCKSKS